MADGRGERGEKEAEEGHEHATFASYYRCLRDNRNYRLEHLCLEPNQGCYQLRFWAPAGLPTLFES